MIELETQQLFLNLDVTNHSPQTDLTSYEHSKLKQQTLRTETMPSRMRANRVR